MAFRVCCGCVMPRVLKPIRRFLQWDSIQPSERTVDTTDWVEGGDGGVNTVHSPFIDDDYETIQTLYMKPIRFGMYGADSTPEPFNPAFNQANERMFSNNQLSTLQARHTQSAMPRIGMLPESSHAWPLNMTTVSYEVPGGMAYRDIPSGETAPSVDYGAEVDAWRVRINGEDVTGIMTGLVPAVTFSNDISLGAVGVDHLTGRWFSSPKLETLFSPALHLNPDDLIEIDVWYKVTRGEGWGTFLSLGKYDFYDESETPGAFRLASATSTSAYYTTEDPPLSRNYIFGCDIGEMNVNRRVPKGYPWTIEYAPGSAWTFGGVGDLNLSNIPAATSRSVYSRPSSKLTIAGVNEWNVTTVTNIDDVVFAPDAGDGVVITHTGAGGSALTASCRYNHLFSASGTLTKVVIWYRARCDAGSDGNIVNVKMRYSVGITVHERDFTPAILTNDWTWYSAEFDGADIAGMSSSSGVQAQFDSELQTEDGWVEIDALYVEKQLSDTITVVQRDTSIEATHANGDKVSFDWAREVPEIIFDNPLAGSANRLALYKPEDSGDYFSGSIVGGGSQFESPGVWNPRADTVFKRFGVTKFGSDLYSPYHFFAFSDAETSYDPYFPEYITLRKN